MTRYLIIRGVQHGGKTTTAGFLFEELAPLAITFRKIFTPGFLEIAGLEYNPDGSVRDFIAFLILDDKLIIIISPGDILEDLESTLDKIEEADFLEEIIGLSHFSDIFIICCARTHNRTGSVYRMLTERIDASKRKEFFTAKSDNKDKRTVKHKIISDIINELG